MVLSQVVAQQETGGAGIMTLLLPVALIVVFWLLLIRPQRKRQREMAEMQQQVQPGERVMTGAGLIGTVRTVEDDEITLEIAPGVEARFVKQSIVRKIDPPTAEDASEDEESQGSDESTDSKASENSTDSEGEKGTADAESGESLPVTHEDGSRKGKK